MAISLKDFQGVDLRVGRILRVEEHPNASKLYVLKVGFGEGENKTIVAGLREHYEREELEGRKAIFVFNLEHVILRGVKSEGMILAAVSDDKSKVVIIEPERDIAEGTKIS
ncbi:MAG: methionine--tRNA ligase subunit beta [Nanoarchaeota archaeon]